MAFQEETPVPPQTRKFVVGDVRQCGLNTNNGGVVSGVSAKGGRLHETNRRLHETKRKFPGTKIAFPIRDWERWLSKFYLQLLMPMYFNLLLFIFK
jgi:hypothetical protein